MQEVFSAVIKTHKPDKFHARVKEGRDYSHKLQVNFKITDGVSEQISGTIAKFF